MRERMALNRGWEFVSRFSEAFTAGHACETETVDLPHTCAETPFHYFDEQIYQRVCGYRRTLCIPASWEGKEVFLCVGAAGHRSEVYLNGEKLCEHRCGYTAFEVPLPVMPGADAQLAILVDSRESLNQPPFGYVMDYMTYGGLYREVWLEARGQRRMADVFLRPALPEHTMLLSGKDSRAEIAKKRFDSTLSTTVTFAGDCAGLTIRQTVRDAQGEIAAEKNFPAQAELSLPVPRAALWDVESPALYTAETLLLDGGTVLDRHEAKIGFRLSQFHADGYYLNGRLLRLRGLNRHQSWPYVGYAAPGSLQRLDADILKKELGLNAVARALDPTRPTGGVRCCKKGSFLDMFRNKKLAADVYSVYQDETPVLNVSSAMDIGECPAGKRGRIFLFTNADEVRMYQDGRFIRSYTRRDSPFKHLSRPPMEITDYIGNRIREDEDFTPTQARLVKDMLNHAARFGLAKLPPSVLAKAAVAMARYGMTYDDAYRLFGKYVGSWGGEATVYRFEALKDGRVTAAVERAPADGRVLRADASSTALCEGDTYDATLVRIRMTDTRGNTLPFFQEPVTLKAEGPIRVIGPAVTVLRGGMGGTIVRTTGKAGKAALTLEAPDADPVRVEFAVVIDG